MAKTGLTFALSEPQLQALQKHQKTLGAKDLSETAKVLLMRMVGTKTLDTLDPNSRKPLLTEYERRLLTLLKDGAKTVAQAAALLEKNKIYAHTIFQRLEGRGWIERDGKMCQDGPGAPSVLWSLSLMGLQALIAEEEREARDRDRAATHRALASDHHEPVERITLTAEAEGYYGKPWHRWSEAQATLLNNFPELIREGLTFEDEFHSAFGAAQAAVDGDGQGKFITSTWEEQTALVEEKIKQATAMRNARQRKSLPLRTLDLLKWVQETLEPIAHNVPQEKQNEVAALIRVYEARVR